MAVFVKQGLEFVEEPVELLGRGAQIAAASSHRCLHIEQYDGPLQTRPLGALAGGAARSLLHGPPFRPCGPLGSCEGLTEERDRLADRGVGGLVSRSALSITKSWMMPW